MARIRSIKPEFCTSESIAALSIPCRLHFAMLWTHADDHGRGADNARLIKAALWPLDDDVDVEQIEQWQQELADNGRLIRYEVEGRRYFQVVNWTEHQHPQKPKPTPIPEPPDTCTRQVRDNDRTEMGSVPSVVVEERRVEGEGEVTVAPLALVAPEPPEPSVDDLFELFWTSYPKKVGKPGAKKAFAKALKRATVAEIGAGLKAWKAAWTDPEYIPHPQTWLNRDGWNDQLPAPKAPPMPAAADTIMTWASS
jgi:hypothetical protein